MKFIWWTLVWWGIWFASDYESWIVNGKPSYEPSVVGLSFIIGWILYIYLYIKFIEKS